MSFTYPPFALNVFVGAILLLFAATVLSAARRDRAALCLGAYLACVGVNFVTIGLAFVDHPVAWAQVAYVASALDGFFLLAFVLLYPYERVARVARTSLSIVGVLSIVSIVLILVRPSDVIFYFAGADANHPARIFVQSWQALLIPVAWLVSLHAVANAPTPTLRTRAAWAAFALGVALATRWSLYAEDWGFQPSIWSESVRAFDPTMKILADGAQAVLLLGVLLVLAWFTIRRFIKDGRRASRRVLLQVAAVAFGLLVATRALQIWSTMGGPDLLTSWAYAIRWIVFAPLLLNGILRYEIIAFEGLLTRWTPRFIAIVLGWGVALMIGGHYHGIGRLDASSFLTALGIGALVGIASGAIFRLALRRWGPAPEEPAFERRLALYQAALEAVYATGSVGALDRKRLERRRRAFGVSTEEARVLEHAISRNLRLRASPIRPGEEPVAGLLIERALGSGSEGRAFLARRYPSGERVVVKEFHGDDSEAVGRLIKSWEGLRARIHPRLPRVLDVHVLQGRPLVVLEYVEGSTVRGPMSEENVARVMEGALDVLEALHKRGLVHRDLKPEHIVLDERGDVHVIDLGLVALSPGRIDAGGTIAGLADFENQNLVGTLAYLAPEIARGEPATPRSDLYALGLITYELLVGRPAIDLRGQSLLSSLETLREPRINLGLAPRSWEAFLRGALAVEPAKRYSSASQMRAALPPKKGSAASRQAGVVRRRATTA